ncbi:terpenoid synthase [Mycena capillaripes]|nr:terpenoid synthase [Mycena capillaripes]
MPLVDLLCAAASSHPCGPRIEAVCSYLVLRGPPLSSTQECLQPFTYTTTNPGKGRRDAFLRAFANSQWISVPEAVIASVSKVVLMLHQASLMRVQLDDIEDSSLLRRGLPAAHQIYGVPRTVNAATYLFCLVHQELYHLRSACRGNHDLSLILTDELIQAHHGQSMELVWRDSLCCPTEAEYIEMVQGKTGALLRLGVRLLIACSATDVENDYMPLVNLLGVHYQIRDDFMNLRSSDYFATKGFAEDIEEGKFSFPIVHGIRTDMSNHEILNILQQRPTTPTLKKHVTAYLESQTKSFDYTLSVLDALEVEIRRQIESFGGNVALMGIVDSLHVDHD